MKILVIGSGGREHALVWKISQSPKITRLYCAPGSAAIGELAECVAIGPEQIEKLADFAGKEKIDLTVVGPELPLTLGITDLFESSGLRIFGPNKAAARLEGSKAFAKEILQQNNIPTAAFGTFTDQASAKRHRTASGSICYQGRRPRCRKGVVISPTIKDALDAIDNILVKKVFGHAGERVVIEEFLEGKKLRSWFTDGEHILPLASSQDHKRVFDNDQGRIRAAWALLTGALVTRPCRSASCMRF
jgi:phosphoribosylamine--glycine ligase